MLVERRCEYIERDSNGEKIRCETMALVSSGVPFTFCRFHFKVMTAHAVHNKT